VRLNEDSTWTATREFVSREKRVIVREAADKSLMERTIQALANVFKFIRDADKLKVNITWERNITWSYDAKLPIDMNANFSETIMGRTVGDWKIVSYDTPSTHRARSVATK
jgi:hypothetical protein